MFFCQTSPILTPSIAHYYLISYQREDKDNIFIQGKENPSKHNEEIICFWQQYIERVTSVESRNNEQPCFGQFTAVCLTAWFCSDQWMFCRRSKATPPSSPDGLVPQVLSTADELIGRFGKRRPTSCNCHHLHRLAQTGCGVTSSTFLMHHFISELLCEVVTMWLSMAVTRCHHAVPSFSPPAQFQDSFQNFFMNHRTHSHTVYHRENQHKVALHSRAAGEILSVDLLQNQSQHTQVEIKYSKK